VAHEKVALASSAIRESREKLALTGIAYTTGRGEFLLNLLLLFAEVFLEALFEFAGEAILDLIQRAVAEVFEMSRAPGPVLAFDRLRGSRYFRWCMQSLDFSTSIRASITASRDQSDNQPYRHRAHDVLDWIDSAWAGQESGSD
jgi:hypothetical protein